MHWTEKSPNSNGELERKLWEAANTLWASAKLKPAEFEAPVLGLIFLRYADHVFTQAKEELQVKSTGRRSGIERDDFLDAGVLFLPETARFHYLLTLPEGSNLAKAVSDAMTAIEQQNPDLKDVLPKVFNKMENRTLKEMFKIMSSIPMDIEGDAFGKIYEYFLAKFAATEGAKGGEFFTPTSIVKLIVDIIEPYKGKIYDPASGSGGMFVQSARFRDEHKKRGTLSVYGQERVDSTVRLCKMNLAVHGLSGDIRQGNTYYEDLHKSVGKFDFVMANPPFNVSKVEKDRLVDDPRFPYGLPRTDNANYLWIQIFASSLSAHGRAGFVMANSAADARASDLEVRRQMIEDGLVDVMVSIGSKFFYTVSLPCTLWFLDKGKKGTPREKTVLFIDARNIYSQLDRAHRDFTPAQGEFIANIVRLYRGEEPDDLYGGLEKTREVFKDLKYADLPGLCKVVTVADVETQGYSLNPGRYVGVAPGEKIDQVEFQERIVDLHEEFESLTDEAHDLERRLTENFGRIL